MLCLISLLVDAANAMGTLRDASPDPMDISLANANTTRPAETARNANHIISIVHGAGPHIAMQTNAKV